MKGLFMGFVRLLATVLGHGQHPQPDPQNSNAPHRHPSPAGAEDSVPPPPRSPLVTQPTLAAAPLQMFRGSTECGKLTRSMSGLLPRSAADIRRLVRLGRERRRRRAARAQRTERTITTMLCATESKQAVVFGSVPSSLPDGRVYVISPGQDVPSGCVHVRCEAQPEEWPVALTVMGLNWKAPTVWLLRMVGVPEPSLVVHLRAVALMSAPGSTVLLQTWSPIAAELAGSVGFSWDALRHNKPLHVLRRNEEQAGSEDTYNLFSSPSCSPPAGPACEWMLVSFELALESLPQAVRDLVGNGSVRVVGSCRDLGQWNVGLGVPLQLAEVAMVGELLLDRRCSEVEYKYIFMDEVGETIWEVGENRRLPATDRTLIRVEDQWRSY